MAITSVIGRAYRLTNADDGNILQLGDAVNGRTGTWLIQCDPAVVGFTGGFIVLGRAYGQACAAAPYIPIPYRRINLGNVASDRALVSDPIADVALIEVPANGISVALEVTVPFGQTCWVYSWPLNGSAT